MMYSNPSVSDHFLSTQEDTLHPFRESPCCASVPPGLTGENRRRSSSDGATLVTRTATVGGHRLSWVDHPEQGGAGGGAIPFRDGVVHGKDLEPHLVTIETSTAAVLYGVS